MSVSIASRTMPNLPSKRVPMIVIDMLVLLSGPVAVGKTTLRQLLLKEHGFEYVRSSAYLIELAANQGDNASRSSLQALGDALDEVTDYKWVLDTVAVPTMAAYPEHKRWLVDAVRKERQVEHFRAEFGFAVLHVHLTAPEQVLRQRYEDRASALDVAGGATPYDVAIAHPNEDAARSLISLADLVIDTDVATPQEAAALVMKCFEVRGIR
jgi:chloramphenicol 3-O-phosphotransferase